MNGALNNSNWKDLLLNELKLKGYSMCFMLASLLNQALIQENFF